MPNSYDSVFDDAGKQAGVDPALLRAVAQTESSGNPAAVSRDASGNPVAYGLMQFTPATAKGIGLADPMDPKASIYSAAKLLRQNLDAAGGDEKTALMMYHGGTDQSNWGPKTQAYPNTVANNKAKIVQQRIASTDPVYQFLSTGQAPKPQAQQQNQPATQSSGDPVYDFLASGGKSLPSQPQQAQTTPDGGDLASVGHGLAGLADSVVGGIGGLVKNVDYAVRRAAQQSPDQATAGANNDGIGSLFDARVAKTINGINSMLGNKTDIRNTAGYQNEATQQLIRFVSENLDKGAQWISQKTGLAPADVSNMIQTAGLAVPSIIKGAKPVVGQALLDTAADDSHIPTAKPSAYEQARASYSQAEPTSPPVGNPQSRPMTGGGAASVNSNPYPVFSGEENARGNADFPQVKTSKIAQDVPLPEQQVRAQIVNEIMGDNAGKVRQGVITGNENTLRSEYTEAKNPEQTPAQAALRSQIADEQDALSKYAQERIDATGANPRLTNDDLRGQLVNDVFHGDDNSLASYFQNAKNQIYQAAKDTVGDNPIPTNHIDTMLSDPQTVAGARIAGTQDVLNGAQDYINLARTVGFKDQFGEFHPPGSVSAFDAVRKAINRNWTPEKATTIRNINSAIDQDIAAAGGSEMYKLGDRVHEAEKNLMGSKGINSIFAPADENGVHTGPVPVSKIMSKLNNMPLDQWSHIDSVLDGLSRGQIKGAPEGMPAVPDALRNAAQAAKNELRGSLAREVYQQGAGLKGEWNQNKVNNTLNGPVGQKIIAAMPPDEVRNFHTLNYGGQIMPGVHSYEGAGLQRARMANPRLMEKYAPKVSGLAGGTIGSAIGPLGSIGGHAIGESFGKKLSETSRAARLEQEGQNLISGMVRNSDLGRPKN